MTLFHGYSHDIIMNAIDARQGVGRRATRDEHVKFLFAGGLFGVLAAVNEAVEDSYWLTLGAGHRRRRRSSSTSPTARWSGRSS